MNHIRLSAAAALALAALVSSGCRHIPTEKEQRASEIHHDLAVQAIHNGNMQEAYGELEESLKLDPSNSRAHNLMGLVLHNGFKRPQEAIPEYQRALELDPQYSEARVNLGNVYLDLHQYDKAIPLYQAALNDMRYATPYIAEGNLGMALYHQGKADDAIGHVKSAVTMNPKFCLGFRNLGTIYEGKGATDEACREFGRYREACPEVADAYYREAVCLAKQGHSDVAAQRFAECEAKAPEGTLKDDCRRLGGQLQ